MVSGDVRPIEFRLLGPPEVLVGGRVVPIGSLQQRAILVALLIAGDATVAGDGLVDVVWGEDPPASAAATLRGLIWRLRKRLVGVDLEFSDVGYRLVTDDETVDARRFDRLVAEARRASERAETEAAAAAFGEALALWRGPALGELASWPFARFEAARLDEARLGAVEDLAEAELAIGRVAEAVNRLESVVREWPLRERAVGQLMLGLYRSGRQAEALAAYQTLRRALANELGLDPTPALRDLEAAILRQRNELLIPSGPAADAARPLVVFGDTAAFLFTDIEASTRAWEGDGAAMASDLASHDAILTDVCAAWDGQVFTHTGDGLGVAFPTVAAAIGAAVDGQRALQAMDWRQTVPLRVRMAIHAGAAQRRGDNWFGPALNRTARLLSVAAGGHVVCSEAAAGLARDLLPDQIELIDSGEVDLPDLVRPERVYQVTHAELPGPLGALRVPARSRPLDNLPAALTAFVGRAEELAELRTLVEASRLVTLVGPGGAGKTRLALEVASSMRDRFPDGVWLVELASVSDEELVARTIASSIGLLVGELAEAGRDVTEALGARLRSRRLLIVLDNCEQVVGAAASVAHALLASCPGLTILVTSREGLAVTGEMVFSVPPLETADAVALFCARACEVNRHFSLNDANADAVVRICRRLDGLPLALEIAAARARVLGTKELAEQLDDRFAALGDGPRSAPARHRTLRAAIDWSYDLLPPPEQDVLHRLAVIPGTFDLGTVRAMAGAEAVAPFIRLVDKSLVGTTGADPGLRYYLSESVRAYAAAKLADTGGTAEAQRSHRDAFLAIAQSWPVLEPDGMTAANFRRLDADYPSFVAALEWSWANGDHDDVARLAARMFVYWMWSGHDEGCDWMERAAGVPASSPAMVAPAVMARIGCAYLLRNFGRDSGGRAESLLAEAIELADTAEDALIRARTRQFAAHLAMATGRLGDARELLGQARRWFESGGSAFAEAVCDRQWAWIELSAGDLEGAQQSVQRLLESLASAADTPDVPHNLGTAALVRARAGDRSAIRLSEEAVAAARRFPVPQVLVMALARATEAAVLLQTPADARPHVVELVDTLRRLGARSWVAEAYELTAIVFGGDQPETAAIALGAADHLRTALGEPAGPAFLLGPALEAARDQLVGVLGPDEFATHKATGAGLPIDEALSLVATRLRDCA
jgi:predicted ATPase/DNA-binding SARP family transcriptional activator